MSTEYTTIKVPASTSVPGETIFLNSRHCRAVGLYSTYRQKSQHILENYSAYTAYAFSPVRKLSKIQCTVHTIKKTVYTLHTRVVKFLKLSKIQCTHYQKDSLHTAHT